MGDLTDWQIIPAVLDPRDRHAPRRVLEAWLEFLGAVRQARNVLVPSAGTRTRN